VRMERVYVVRRRWILLPAMALLLGGASGLAAVADHDSGGAPATREQRPAQPTGSPAEPPSPTSSPSAVSVPSPIPGDLLIADRANARMLLVDSRKRILWMYPRPGVRPSFPFFFDDDAFFGRSYHVIISQQEEQQTIQLISFPQGKVLWHYGHVNTRGSTSGYLSTPDDAYLRPDGIVSVADVRNCRVLFISPAGKVVRQIGTTGVCSHNPPLTLASPNGDTPLPDGGTLVTEIGGSWIDAIGPTGRLEWTVHAPVGYPSDAQWLGGGRILLADYSSPGHVLIMNTKGKVLWRYGPSSGSGRLDHPSLALLLPNGLIALNDDYRDRVVLIDQRKHRIVWQYGHTDVPGTAPGYLHVPDGMDFLPFVVAQQIPGLRS